jgi:acetolactate synthase-1/2/3 large subunit
VLESDLVFFAGSAMGSQTTFNWQLPRPGTRTIQLEIDPEQLGRHWPDVMPLLGDAKVTLAQICESVPPVPEAERRGWLDRIAAIKAEWREQYLPLLESDDVPLRPERLCAELSRALPQDALLVVDTGHAGMWTAHMVELTKPGQGYLRAAGSLGWAFPAGIGAKLAAPDRPVVVFTGDGGFWYHLAELETAVRWHAGMVVVVNNNNALNQEIGPVTKAYGGRLHGRHHELWQFAHVDFARVAESVSAKGLRVTRPDELEGALAGAIEQAEDLRLPVVLDVVTDPNVTAPLGYVEET